MVTALDIVWQKELSTWEWRRHQERLLRGAATSLLLWTSTHHLLSQASQHARGQNIFLPSEPTVFLLSCPPRAAGSQFCSPEAFVLTSQMQNCGSPQFFIYNSYMSICVCVCVMWVLVMCQSTKNLVHYDLVGELRIENWPLETRISISSMQFNSKQIKCIFATYLVATYHIFLFFMIIYYSKPQRYCVFRYRSLK